MMMMMIPMKVTLVGIVTDASDEQEAKASYPSNRVRVSTWLTVNNDDNTNIGNTSRNSNRR